MSEKETLFIFYSIEYKSDSGVKKEEKSKRQSFPHQKKSLDSYYASIPVKLFQSHRRLLWTTSVVSKRNQRTRISQRFTNFPPSYWSIPKSVISVFGDKPQKIWFTVDYYTSSESSEGKRERERTRWTFWFSSQLLSSLLFSLMRVSSLSPHQKFDPPISFLNSYSLHQWIRW